MVQLATKPMKKHRHA